MSRMNIGMQFRAYIFYPMVSGRFSSGKIKYKPTKLHILGMRTQISSFNYLFN